MAKLDGFREWITIAFTKVLGWILSTRHLSYNRGSMCGNLLRKLFSSLNFNALFPTFILFKEISSKPGVKFRIYIL